jgi:hypothetical protein
MLRATAMPASFKDIQEAFDFADTSASFGEDRAFLCRRTGKVYWHSESSDFDGLFEELPDDIEDEEKYLAIPNKRELGLGKPLVLDFAREWLPNDFDEIRDIFNKSGAYRKFRALVTRRDALERWHAFEAKATEQALRDWCELHSITVTD